MVICLLLLWWGGKEVWQMFLGPKHTYSIVQHFFSAVFLPSVCKQLYSSLPLFFLFASLVWRPETKLRSITKSSKAIWSPVSASWPRHKGRCLKNKTEFSQDLVVKWTKMSYCINKGAIHKHNSRKPESLPAAGMDLTFLMTGCQTVTVLGKFWFTFIHAKLEFQIFEKFFVFFFCLDYLRVRETVWSQCTMTLPKTLPSPLLPLPFSPTSTSVNVHHLCSHSRSKRKAASNIKHHLIVFLLLTFQRWA